MHRVHSNSNIAGQQSTQPPSIDLPPRPVLDWWEKPRAATASALPAHIRSDAQSSPLGNQSKYDSFFSLFGVPTAPIVHLDDSDDEDAFPVRAPAGALPSSPAALFLSGLHTLGSPPSSTSSPDSDTSSSKVTGAQDDVVAGYKLGPVIGHGAFSVVRKAFLLSSSTSVAAVKIIRKDDSRPGASEARVRLTNESALWSQLSHEHILPLFQSAETPSATFLFTLYCPVGTLLDVINSHKEDGLEGVGMDDAGMLFRQIVRGLKYLHEVVRLVHGDIKLENVLVDDQGSCRIADFGLARWMNKPDDHPTLQIEDDPTPRTSNPDLSLSIHLSLQRPRGRHDRAPLAGSRLSYADGQERKTARSKSRHRVEHYFPPGSLPYAAPELLEPSPSPIPNPAQDIWALGCVLYALLFGQLPFSDPFEPRLQMKIMRGVWQLPATYRSAGRGRSRSRSARRDASASRTRAKSRSRGPKSPVAGKYNSPPTRPGLVRSGSKSVIAPLKTIGKVAENVLQGCLCANLPDRWSISMIDEVGWGVGWDLDVDEAGEEFDDKEDDLLEDGPGDLSTSASTDSMDSMGRRLYILPPERPALNVNKLYTSTIELVTSPTTPTCASRDEQTPRSRSRGKRGKGSRSSSRTPLSRPGSGTVSPVNFDQPDPLAAFREGFVPSSIMIPGGSKPTSKTNSRAPSRTGSMERIALANNEIWGSRGRQSSSWRMPASSSTTAVCGGLPTEVEEEEEPPMRKEGEQRVSWQI